MRSQSWALVAFAILFGWPSVVAAQETRVFPTPTLEGRRLDLCLVWGEQCGQPAADAFCRAQGFDRANAWVPAENIGGTEPTVVMTGRAVCSHADCDGFASITCTRAARALADYARRIPRPTEAAETPAPAAEPEPAPAAPPETPPAEPAAETPVVEAVELEPWTTQDVIDPRIDVQAQYAIMRMFMGEPLERIVASHILGAVKDGSLGGIYQEDQQVPALRAQSLGYGWWQILPYASSQPRIDGLCMIEPADRPPILVMRRGAQKNAAAYDAALQNAWATCDLPPGPVRPYLTTLPAKQPPPKASACANPTEGSTTLAVLVHSDNPEPWVTAEVAVSKDGPSLIQIVNIGFASFFTLEEGGLWTASVKPLPPTTLLPASRVVDVIPSCAQSVAFRLRPTGFAAEPLMQETACMLNHGAMTATCARTYSTQLRECQDHACREAALKEYNDCMEWARRVREDCSQEAPQ